MERKVRKATSQIDTARELSARCLEKAHDILMKILEFSSESCLFTAIIHNTPIQSTRMLKYDMSFLAVDFGAGPKRYLLRVAASTLYTLNAYDGCRSCRVSESINCMRGAIVSLKHGFLESMGVVRLCTCAYCWILLVEQKEEWEMPHLCIRMCFSEMGAQSPQSVSIEPCQQFVHVCQPFDLQSVVSQCQIPGNPVPCNPICHAESMTQEQDHSSRQVF